VLGCQAPSSLSFSEYRTPQLAWFFSSKLRDYYHSRMLFYIQPCQTTHYFELCTLIRFAVKWASVRHTCLTALHTSFHGILDTVCDRLPVTRSEQRVCALNLMNALFLTLDHMRGRPTVFRMTFDLHPGFILLSDFLRLIFSVMHFSRSYCTVPVFFL
jgi:hypothetical protein